MHKSLPIMTWRKITIKLYLIILYKWLNTVDMYGFDSGGTWYWRASQVSTLKIWSNLETILQVLLHFLCFHVFQIIMVGRSSFMVKFLTKMSILIADNAFVIGQWRRIMLMGAVKIIRFIGNWIVDTGHGIFPSSSKIPRIFLFW